MKKPLVSVIVPAYNIEKLTINCVKSILKQSFKDFELIVVDDCSKDNTLESLKKFKDKRLRIFKTHKNSGPSVSRNIGIDKSRGEYIFFIDGDCIASKNWIKEGLKVFEEERCAGVEGKIYYVSKNYKPTAIERITENRYGGKYMTASNAYLKSVVIKVGKFDPALMRMQDRDIAFKIMRLGKIVFCQGMTVTHQRFLWTFKKLRDNLRDDAHDKIVLFKRFNDKSQLLFRIYRPLNLLGTIFPPAIFGILFLKRYKTFKDFKTILWVYPSIFLERVSLWKNSLKEGVFIV